MQTASVDRELVKGLVLKGFSNAEVCAQTGVADNVLRVWKVRYGWTQLLKGMHKALEVTEATRKPVPADNATTKSEQIKTSIADEIVADLNVIRQKQGKTLKAVRERQGLLSTVIGNASTLFGWSEHVHNTIFNFPLMDSARLDPAPAIDVQSQALPDKSQPIDTTPVSSLDNQSNTTDAVSSAKPTA